MEVAGINWNTIIGALGPTGVLVWYVWYTQTVSFPRVSKEHSDETKTLVAEHAAEMKNMAEGYHKTIDGLSQRFHATLDRLVADFRQDLKDERATRAQELAALREWFNGKAAVA